MQARLHAELGTPYYPELLLQPEDIAAAVICALRLPRTAEITDLHIRPAIKCLHA
jgi:NADP-dependent 3-hydroxy acid dehydrogenase YdfG